jgi:hypothetical protein
MERLWSQRCNRWQPLTRREVQWEGRSAS